MARPNRLERSVVTQAVHALMTHVNNSAEDDNSLFDTAATISLSIALRKIPDQGKLNPLRVDIPHSLYSPEEGAEMCLFVKEGDKNEVKARLLAEPVPGLRKVISLQKLRTDYSRYDDRRKLCANFDLFLADDRILPMLPKALGKAFFDKKKHPVPVKVTRAGVGGQIARVRDSTYMYLGWGPCTAIRIAKSSMTEEQVVDNIMEGMKGIIQYIPRGWKNVQAVHIKTHESVALPVYNSLADSQRLLITPQAAPARAVAAVAAVEASGAERKADDSEGESGSEEEAEEVAAPVVQKKKKRAASAAAPAAAASATPAKRAKRAAAGAAPASERKAKAATPAAKKQAARLPATEGRKKKAKR